MAIGTIFTLFVLPSVYVLVAKDHSKDRVRAREFVQTAEPVPAK
jgi:multidrug efflux pump